MANRISTSNVTGNSGNEHLSHRDASDVYADSEHNAYRDNANNITETIDFRFVIPIL